MELFIKLVDGNKSNSFKCFKSNIRTTTFYVLYGLVPAAKFIILLFNLGTDNMQITYSAPRKHIYLWISLGHNDETTLSALRRIACTAEVF